VRADGVVDAFPGTGLTIDGVDGPGGESEDFIELLGVSALGAFDRAIELGRAGREHEQAQPISLLASWQVRRFHPYRTPNALKELAWPGCAER
jgi:hypothetical protein